MKGLLNACIREKKITILMAAMVFLFGLYQYYLIPKQENPQVSYPGAMITTVYPGASPEAVEKLVSKPLENEVSKIEGFKLVHSYSQNSVSIVYVELYNEANQEKAWRELRQNVNDAEAKLPKGIEKPVVNTKLAETAGIILSFSGGSYSYDQLGNFAEEFEKELLKIEGVERFELIGKLKKEVKVEVLSEKLVRYGISLDEIHQILQVQNIEIPSGAIKNEEIIINVNTPGRFESLSDIRNVVVKASGENAGMVRLKDVANVYMGLEDGSTKIKRNGENSVILSGYFRKGENIVLVGREVRAQLDKIKTGFPEDLIIDEVIFLPQDIENAVNNFMSSLLQGVIFVIIVVFLGMCLKNAIVVSTAIPLSIMATFACMNAMKMQIDQISTAALIIALGMLVDNAIVIADAVQKKIDEGLSHNKAAFEGAKENALPVFTATLTTIAAFSPLLLLPGVEGEYLSSIPKVVIVSLSASYLVAMLVVPALSAALFKKNGGRDHTEKIKAAFLKLFDYAITQKKVTISISLAIFVLSLLASAFIPMQFFPPADKALIYMNITSEKNNLEDTEKVAKQVEDILLKQPAVTGCLVSIGDSFPTFYITVEKQPMSKDFAQILCNVDLKKSEELKSNIEFAQYLQKLMDKSVLGGKAAVRVLENTDALEAPVCVRVSGERLDRIREVTEELKSRVETIKGTTNVRDDIIRKAHEFVVRVDEQKASSMGISKYDVAWQVNLALNGDKATTYQKANNSFEILVKSNINDREKLGNLLIKSPLTGTKVLLKELGKIHMEPKTQLIKRYKKEIAQHVFSDVDPKYSAVDITNKIESEILPKMNVEGVNITFDGEREQIEKGFGNMGISALFALFAIYMILMLQFKSFRQPIIIMVTVPLALVGCILGLLVTRNPLSFTGFLGIASLVGIVVNNAILLLDHISAARSEDYVVNVACREAVAGRIRPILLSTVTTVIGLAPLVYQGNPMLTPMAIVLMSGLIVSTVLTIVVIPVIYSIVEK